MNITNKPGENMTPQNLKKIEEAINDSLDKADISALPEAKNQQELGKIYDSQLKTLKEENKNALKPKHFKNFNAQLTLDSKNNSVYIYVPPNMTKTPIKPDKYELIQGNFGYIYLDYLGGKIIGVEILDADKYFDLK